MKVTKIALALILSIAFLGASSMVGHATTSLGYTNAEFDKDLMRQYIIEKIKARNAQLSINRGYESDYSRAYSNAAYTTVNYVPTISSNYVPETRYASLNRTYNPGSNYVVLYPSPGINNTQYSLQKDSSIGSLNLRNRYSYDSIRNKYSIRSSYLSPEINRAIINKENGYSLHEGSVGYNYYTYFFTYSNNEYNKNSGGDAVVRGYINDLIEDNFHYLSDLKAEVVDDIHRIKGLLSSIPDNSYYNNSRTISFRYDRDLLKSDLEILYKIKRQIEDDKKRLDYLIRATNY